MRIFGKFLHAFRISRLFACNSITQRTYSSSVCASSPHSLCLAKFRTLHHSTTPRLFGTKSGNSKFVNRRVRRSSRRRYDKSKTNKRSATESTPSQGNSSDILPVALINNSSHKVSSLKILLIPINLFEGGDESVEKIWATLSIIRDNARQIEAFTNHSLNSVHPKSILNSPNKSEDNDITSNSNNTGNDTPFQITGSIENQIKQTKTIPSRLPDPQFLSDIQRPEELTLWPHSEQHNGTITLYDGFDKALAEQEMNIMFTCDTFNIEEWITGCKFNEYASTSRRLPNGPPPSPKKSEWNVKGQTDAEKLNYLTERGSDTVLEARESTLLQEAPHTPTSCPGTIPDLQTENSSQNFNALMEAFQLGSSERTPGNETEVKLPELNEYLKYIYSIASRGGFPADTGRMSYSTKSGEESTKRSPHIVCVRKGDKGCISPGLADNPKFMSSGSASGSLGIKEKESEACPEDDAALARSRIIEKCGIRELMSCKAYAKALVEAQKRRAEIKTKKESKDDCKPCSPSRDTTSKTASSPKEKKAPAGDPCTETPLKKEQKADKPKKDDCGETKKEEVSCEERKFPDECYVRPKSFACRKIEGATKEKKDSGKPEKKSDTCKSAKAEKPKDDKAKNPCNSEKPDPCKTDKTEKPKDPCKKDDKAKGPCKSEKKADACKSAKAEKPKDPCKKDDKAKDPCKSEKKADPCKSAKAEKPKDPCKKDDKAKDPCKSEKKADSSKSAKAEKPKDPCKKDDKAKDPCKSLKKVDPCKSAKAEKPKDTCKKDDKAKDPCKSEKKADPCKSAKAEKPKDTCKKDDKAKDPCKSEKKSDPCKSAKAEKPKDTCKKDDKAKDPCKSEKKADSSKPAKAEKPKDPCKKGDKAKDPCKSLKKVDPCKSAKADKPKDPSEKDKSKYPCKSKKKTAPGKSAKAEKPKDTCKSEKKTDPCKSAKAEKSNDPCKKDDKAKDTCQSGKKADSCKPSMADKGKDPCKKVAKSKDPKKPTMAEKGKDPCKKAEKSKDTCKSEKADPCKTEQKDDTCKSAKADKDPGKKAKKSSKSKKSGKCSSSKKKSKAPSRKSSPPEFGSVSGGKSCASPKEDSKSCGASKPAAKPESPCADSKPKECKSEAKPSEAKPKAKGPEKKAAPGCPSATNAHKSTKPNCPAGKKPVSGDKGAGSDGKGSGGSGPCATKKSFSTTTINSSVTKKFGKSAPSILKKSHSFTSWVPLRFYTAGKKVTENTDAPPQCTTTKMPKKRFTIKREPQKCFGDEEETCGKKDFCDPKLALKKDKRCPKVKVCSTPAKSTESPTDACKSFKKENKKLLIKSLIPSTLPKKNSPNVDTSRRKFCTSSADPSGGRCDLGESGKKEENEPTNQVIKIVDACKIETISNCIPRFSDYDVLIRTHSIAISGSDIHVYETGGRKSPGITIGHDASGIIEKAGKCVQNLKPGDRVAIESGLSCGICNFCKRGAYNICSQLMHNGFFATFQVHPADLCHKLPEMVSLEEGCLVQILATGCHACCKARIKPTANVLIIGSSPIAIAAAMCARAIGANRVCFLCCQETNLEMIRKTFNFEYVIYDESMTINSVVESVYCFLREWPDVIINCAVNNITLNIGVMASAPNGICVMAECESECASFNAMEVIMKNLKLISSFRSTNMFPTALLLMETGQAPMHNLIAKTYQWANIDSAFVCALHHSNVSNKKVIVTCGT